jgi:hypothetical protein
MRHVGRKSSGSDSIVTSKTILKACALNGDVVIEEIELRAASVTSRAPLTSSAARSSSLRCPDHASAAGGSVRISAVSALSALKRKCGCSRPSSVSSRCLRKARAASVAAFASRSRTSL